MLLKCYTNGSIVLKTKLLITLLLEVAPGLYRAIEKRVVDSFLGIRTKEGEYIYVN